MLFRTAKGGGHRLFPPDASHSCDRHLSASQWCFQEDLLLVLDDITLSVRSVGQVLKKRGNPISLHNLM